MKRSTHVILGLAIGVSAAANDQFMHAAAAAVPRAHGPAVFAVQRSSISGHVFGDTRRPVPDVHVELLDDLGVTLSRTRTNGAGRYTFFGLVPARYRVRAMPFGTDYQEQTKDVELVSISIVEGGGSDNQQVDFYLRLREGANAGPLAAPGAVFAQEVPPAARKLFERGVVELREKREKEAYESLKRSLEIFPDYYMALDRLGTEYVVRGYYHPALILLTRAVAVNPRGYSSAFGLGLAQYHLRLNKEAIDSLQRATTLYAKSPTSHLYLGLALQRAGKLGEAEAAFKSAEKLSQGKYADAHWNLALLYRTQERYNEAADELERFLKAQPNSRDAEKIRQLIRQLREKAATKASTK